MPSPTGPSPIKPLVTFSTTPTHPLLFREHKDRRRSTTAFAQRHRSNMVPYPVIIRTPQLPGPFLPPKRCIFASFVRVLLLRRKSSGFCLSPCGESKKLPPPGIAHTLAFVEQGEPAFHDFADPRAGSNTCVLSSVWVLARRSWTLPEPWVGSTRKPGSLLRAPSPPRSHDVGKSEVSSPLPLRRNIAPVQVRLSGMEPWSQGTRGHGAWRTHPRHWERRLQPKPRLAGGWASGPGPVSNIGTRGTCGAPLVHTDGTGYLRAPHGKKKAEGVGCGWDGGETPTHTVFGGSRPGKQQIGAERCLFRVSTTSLAAPWRCRGGPVLAQVRI